MIDIGSKQANPSGVLGKNAARNARTSDNAPKIDVYTYYPEIFAYNKNVDAAYFFEEEKELNGFYRSLRLNGYTKYFPLWALSRYRNLTQNKV